MRWLAPAVLALFASSARGDPPPITFADAIVRAIANNPTRRIAVLDIARERALLAQATSALLPQISAAAVYTRLEGDRFVAMRLEAAANSETAGLVLTMPLFDLGAYANRRRAQDQVAVSAAESESIKRDVAIETAHAYFAAFTAARLVEVAQHARDTAQGHVDYTTSRRQGGVGNELDVSRARTELATDEAQLAAATTALIRAEEALGVITGSAGPLAAGEEPALPQREGPGIASRADVIAIRQQRAAAEESSALDWTLWTPTLRVTASGFLTAPVIPPLPRAGYYIALTLNVPLYEGGFRRGVHAQHRAVLAQAQEAEVGTVRQALAEIAVAESALGNARRARDAARRAAEAAAKTLELASLGYRAGTASGLDVIDASRAARDTDTQAVLADTEYREAQLDLLASTGAFP